jgi:dihydrofolate reductase
MGLVISNMSMSLDGVVNGEQDGINTLFEWYNSGDKSVHSESETVSFSMEKSNADFLTEEIASIGAIIGGRRIFDEAKGWGGKHPTGAPVVILTHTIPEGWPREDSSVEFITEGGIEAAVKRARELAGDKDVTISTPDMIRQCLEADLLDVVTIDLIPVILGRGKKYFDQLSAMKVRLEEPIIKPGVGVTHLYFRIKH